MYVFYYLGIFGLDQSDHVMTWKQKELGEVQEEKRMGTRNRGGCGGSIWSKYMINFRDILFKKYNLCTMTMCK